MRKNVLALSIAAMIGGIGFAGAASAAVLTGTGAPGTLGSAVPTSTTLTQATSTSLAVSDGGVGHMLLVPYYTAQNNNMTVIHLVNTDTVNGKAVKVRFRGAANSDDVMDFQVFMSPGDVWTASVQAGTGVANIRSNDTTCTVPALGKDTPVDFSTGRLNPLLTTDAKANQTREGYVEIFNMADIPSNLVYGASANANSALYTATKHVGGVAPCSVAGSAAETTLFNVALAEYTEATAAAAGFNTPSGGLMSDWYIINVPETTTFSGGSTAVLATGGNGRGKFVHFPQIDSPVASTDIDEFTADPLLRTDATNAAGVTYATVARPVALAAGKYDLPDFSTPYIGAAPTGDTAPLVQASFLTAALAVSSVTNQYANDAVIAAKTDWVFSMPTRRYSVAANYAAITAATPANTANADYRLFSTLSSSWFVPANTPVDSNGSGNICVVSDGQRFFDREETTPGASAPRPVFSPQTPGSIPNVTLCGEASVLAFKDTTKSVLASSVARTTLTEGSYENGWGYVLTENGGVGLPILGFASMKLSNSRAATDPNGVTFSGTYGITWPHRFTGRIVAPAPF